MWLLIDVERGEGGKWVVKQAGAALEVTAGKLIVCEKKEVRLFAVAKREVLNATERDSAGVGDEPGVA